MALAAAAAIPLAVAGAQLVGGWLGNQQAAQNTAQSNRINQIEAQKNREFQAYMSNSAYQRGMEDMRRAGINPMLAYMKGGASTPGGAQATAQAAPYQDPIGPAATSAADTHMRGQSLAQGLEGLNIQKGQLAVAQANSQADVALKAAQAAATASTAKQTEAQTQAILYDMKKKKLEGDFYGSDAGKTFYNLQKINEAAGGSLDTINSAKDLLNPWKFIPKKEKINPKHNNRKGVTDDGTFFDPDTGEVLGDTKFGRPHKP